MCKDAQAIFADICQLDKPCSIDTKTGFLHELKTVSIFIAGFVCTSVSMLNAKRHQFGKSIQLSQGNTGVTFQGVVKYCKTHEPRIVMLENVEGLVGDNLKACVGQLQAAGYKVIFSGLKLWQQAAASVVSV